ncbi:MAG TPA: hypothetical protein VGE98_07835, partial [Thermoanaerobaculia bacterium]
MTSIALSPANRISVLAVRPSLNPRVAPARRAPAVCLGLALWMLCLVAAGPLLAQLPPKAEELQLHAVTLKHQPAVDGMQLIQGLLSPRGAVELQPGSNTLVIRDTGQALARILPVLRSDDHAPRPIKIEVVVVR